MTREALYTSRDFATTASSKQTAEEFSESEVLTLSLAGQWPL